MDDENFISIPSGRRYSGIWFQVNIYRRLENAENRSIAVCAMLK